VLIEVSLLRCNTLQHTAPHCTALQHTAPHCTTLHHTALHCYTLQHTATHCNTLQHAAHCNTLYHIPGRQCFSAHQGTGWRRLIGSPKFQIIFHKSATKYRSLLRKMTYEDKGSYESSPPCISLTSQHTATHCNTLQHTAAHWYTLQHMAPHCTNLQHTAAHCATLHNTAMHCTTLQ